MKNLVQAATVAMFAAVLSCPSAKAFTFTQVGDTGQTLDAAQVITGGPSSLDSIAGTLSSPNTIGLFQLFLTGGQTFSATTINAETLLELPVDLALGRPTTLLVDPQLFLFDAAGRGVYGNDDTFDGTTQATLPSGGFSPAQSGTYFLAIASAGYTPVSTIGEIFAADSSGLLTPTLAGAASPLSRFSGQGTSRGRYQIALSGTTASTAVPEPEQTVGLIAIGVLGAAYRLRRRKTCRALK